MNFVGKNILIIGFFGLDNIFYSCSRILHEYNPKFGTPTAIIIPKCRSAP